MKRGFRAFIWSCKPVLSLKRCFYRKISTAASFPKSQTIITHLVADGGFFWTFPPDPVIKPTWSEIEDSFISPWQLSLLLPAILPNLSKQHPAIKATWQAFKALDKLTMHKISHSGKDPAIKINGLRSEGHGSGWVFFGCEERSSSLTIKLCRT